MVGVRRAGGLLPHPVRRAWATGGGGLTAAPAVSHRDHPRHLGGGHRRRGLGSASVVDSLDQGHLGPGRGPPTACRHPHLVAAQGLRLEWRPGRRRGDPDSPLWVASVSLASLTIFAVGVRGMDGPGIPSAPRACPPTTGGMRRCMAWLRAVPPFSRRPSGLPPPGIRI